MRWRTCWALYAGTQAVSLLFLLLARNWIAAFFCSASIYYCLLGRWREGTPFEQPENPVKDNPEKDYAELFPMNDLQLVDEFDKLTDRSDPNREPNIGRLNRCMSLLASHHIASIKQQREAILR